MDITYLGGNSYLLEAQRSVVINPPDASISGAIILHSHRRNERRQVVDGPGEYEIAGVLIATVETGRPPETALTHAIELDGINVVHVGSASVVLGSERVAALGTADILLLPVEDVRAAEVLVRELEPRVVIPSGTHAAALCAEIGAADLRLQPRFSWNGTGTAPKAVLLRATARRPRAA